MTAAFRQVVPRERSGMGAPDLRSPGLMTMAVISLVLFMSTPLASQERPRQWERRLEVTRSPLTAFHATQAINLPTAETLRRGEWQFEVAHRFLPAISSGYDALWGLDGGATMRLALGYAPHDRVLVTLGRSNLQDNLDIQLKFRAWETDAGPFPLLVAVQAGGAWNDLPDSNGEAGEAFQAYGQLVLNTLLADRLALGLVPSFLHNVLPDSTDRLQELYLGLYAQWYLNEVVSVLGEWRLGEGSGELPNDPGTVGIELETGGHFFKVFVTNSIRLNPSQFLAGSDFPFEADEWRLGFAITRLLRF